LIIQNARIDHAKELVSSANTAVERGFHPKTKTE
jgi:hypothetical protein